MKKVFLAIQTYWLPLTLMTLAAITFLSLRPLEQLPDIPGTDKTHHLIAYAVLIFPAAFRKTKHWLLLAVVFVIYSGAIELIQPYVNRYGEWLDLAANAAGIIIGGLLGFFANQLFTRK